MMNECYLEVLTGGVKAVGMHPYLYHVKSRKWKDYIRRVRLRVNLEGMTQSHH
jgi:hypothetical protein